MMINYIEFLESKQFRIEHSGFDISHSDINPILFPFQKDIVKWAVKKGRCAMFLDTGLGKTFIQLEWARIINKRTLIFAPLSVARQTIREGKKINIDVHYVRDESEMIDGINIANYEMLDHFSESCAEAIVLDESSILKSLSGITRKKITKLFRGVSFKMCCTATPAPNDFTEIGNHAEFLNICSMQEMLAMFFINANKEHTIAVGDKLIIKKGTNAAGTEWRIKHHAEDKFFQWLSKWALLMTMPSDLGYEDNGFILPTLNIIPMFVKSDFIPEGSLFFTGLSGLKDRADVRANSIDQKIELIKRIISDEQMIVWCGLDKESREALKLFGDISREVTGTDSPEKKAQAFEDFQDGKFQVLITKAKIGGFGMNFQNANKMIFFGLNDSWETFYQAIRREWRFGQTRPVTVYIILSEKEREVYENVLRKDAQAKRLKIKMIELLKDFEKNEIQEVNVEKDIYQERTENGNGWTAMLGDSCKRMAEIESDSIDMSVYSPPFADLFIYSNSLHDLGNCKNWDEFFEHYKYISSEVLRVTRPGRLSCVHTSDIPAMANRDGYIGLKDFPGRVIQLHQGCGWVFVGRAFIQKNPQAQAIRVKSKSLLFVQLNKDSSHSRPALVDQILIFKKPGENNIPIEPVKNGELDNNTWISWAHGIWTDISETDTLQFYHAREKSDEKHICPLQLGTIERCIKLYSNPGETIFTPFMGIGSEAFVAIRNDRKAIGIELKESYFNVAVNNLLSAKSRKLKFT
jgi:DNA modification methylase/superfamily II DNA or RNA helicase